MGCTCTCMRAWLSMYAWVYMCGRCGASVSRGALSEPKASALGLWGYRGQRGVSAQRSSAAGRQSGGSLGGEPRQARPQLLRLPESGLGPPRLGVAFGGRPQAQTCDCRRQIFLEFSAAILASTIFTTMSASRAPIRLMGTSWPSRLQLSTCSSRPPHSAGCLWAVWLTEASCDDTLSESQGERETRAAGVGSSATPDVVCVAGSSPEREQRSL